MWNPTPQDRILLGGAGIGVLLVALALSFFGPAAVMPPNPQPSGAAQEATLLQALEIASLPLVGLAVWFGSDSARVSAVVGGAAAAFLGTVLSFGFWRPAGDGWYYAPYSLQGALVLQWGMLVFLVGILSFLHADHALARRDRLRAPAQ